MSAAPAGDAEPLAVAVTESIAVAESRGAGSEASADEGPLASPRGLGTMTGRAPGTTTIIAGVRLASHKVNVVIRDGLARTEVEETFENTTARVLEGRYVFPVPPDASVSRLALYVGTELVEGEIVERERAARIFKGIVEDTVRPRDPALLEWVKGSEISLKVFPLPAHGTRMIVLAYDQVLSQVSNQVRYLYPLSLGQDRSVTIDDLRIDVTAGDATTSLVAVRTPGYAATTAPSGPLHVGYSARAFTPSGDFILEYERAPSSKPDVSAYLAPTTAAGIGKTAVAEDGYLTMRLPVRAPPVTQARVSHDRAIVLDISQSQSKETLAGEIAVARGLLRRLDGGERFSLLACDSACTTFPDDGLAAAAPATLDDAGRWLSTLAPGGSSDIAGAILAATRRLVADRAGQIVYLGDGAASAGELTAETIAARVRPEILARKIDVRLFGAGRSVDEIVLGGLARSLGAAYEAVSTGEPLARRIDAIALGLDNPLLVDAALEVPEGIYDVHPKVLPNLHAGQELMITARARAGEHGEITIKGTLGGAPYQDARAIVWDASPATVPPRLWATAKIADLEASSDEASRKEVVALSRSYRVMSRAASFLVLENDQMFSAFGIERKAKKGPAEPDVAGLLKELEGASGGMVGLLDGHPSGASSIIASADPAANAPSLDAVGAGGLGLSGIGEGGGGAGLGSVGTLGHGAGTGEGQGFGSGHGRLGGEHRAKPPSVRMGAVSVSGALPPEVIQRIVRQNFGRFRLCYENGLRSNPDLQGRVSVRFTIGADGNVASTANGGSDLPDGNVIACVVRSFGGLMFPAPEGGNVVVTYEDGRVALLRHGADRGARRRQRAMDNRGRARAREAAQRRARGRDQPAKARWFDPRPAHPWPLRRGAHRGKALCRDRSRSAERAGAARANRGRGGRWAAGADVARRRAGDGAHQRGSPPARGPRLRGGRRRAARVLAFSLAGRAAQDRRRRALRGLSLPRAAR